MDALVHAVEGYITKGAWELTDMLHLKAIEIIGRSLRSAVAGDYAGREAMSLGQYIAGMGFSNVGLGIVHSMAHPLSAVYDIPHGKACAMLLTAVLKFNAPETGGYGVDHVGVVEALGCKAIRVHNPDELAAALAEAPKIAKEYRVPVVVEAILERVTNISMGAAIDNVNEFEEVAENPTEDAPCAIGLAK